MQGRGHPLKKDEKPQDRNDDCGKIEHHRLESQFAQKDEGLNSDVQRY